MLASKAKAISGCGPSHFKGERCDRVEYGEGLGKKSAMLGRDLDSLVFNGLEGEGGGGLLESNRLWMRIRAALSSWAREEGSQSFSEGSGFNEGNA